MSKKVDERVVEMRFDNAQFESGVKTTMSTLDKLKAALKFPASAKSLDSISNAAKKVDFSGMQQGIETVNAKFSAMQVVGMTALSNITSAAMRAGTNLVKSLAIDPVVGGFREYETQLNSVQTILANTKSKGSTIEDVTAALDELNDYADKTIYNFTEMTRNIGTFTAAGVGLDQSVSAIKGIANLAAVSGSNSTKASMAMYQLSQALAAGRVSLMDWNSVVSAGMGGELFQNALIRTSRVMGTGVDAALEKYGTFRESLTQGQWLTADVLTETLSQISGAYDEAELRAQGYNDEQIKQILDLADTATKAATEVKTFSQLMGTVSESIGSGWAKTWQLIFGDFEEAKTFWTGIWNDTLSPMIEGMSDARNSVLEGAMGDGGAAAWDEFSARIKDAGVSTEQFQKALKDTGTPIDELIKKHGSLAAAMASGEVSANSMVAALKHLGIETINVNGPLRELIVAMTRPSGRELFLESLKNLLMAILKPLQAVGDAFNAVFGLDSEGLYNIIAGFNEFTKSLVMDADTVDNLSRTLKGLFSVIHLVTTAVGNAFTIGFKVANAVLGFFGTNLLEVTAILGDALFSLDRWITSGDMLRDILSGIGSAFSWLIEPVKNFIDSVAGFPVIESAIKSVGDAFNWLLDQLHAFSVSPTNFFENLSFDFSWEGVLSALSSFGVRVREVFSNIGAQLTTVGPDIIAGLQNGLAGGWDSVIGFLTDLANRIVEAVKAVLGIHSPSTVFFDIGKNIIEGLVNGIKFISGKIAETLTAIFEDIKSVLGTIDWGTILTVAAGAGTFTVFYKLTDALQSFGDAAENLTSPFKAFDNFSKSLDRLAKAKSFEMKAEAIKSIAIAIGILAGSLVVLSQIDPAALWSSVGALTVMGGILAGIVVVMGKFGKGKGSSGIKQAVTQMLDLAKLAGLMISIGASMLMLAGAMAIIGGMDAGQVKQAGIVLATFGGVVAALIAITKIAGSGDLDKAGKFVSKIGTAFLLLAITARLLGGMSAGEMDAAIDMIGTFGIVVAALVLVTQFGGSHIDGAAKFISKVGTAFLLLTVAAKLMGGMNAGEMGAAKEMLSMFGILVMGLIAVTKLAGKHVDQLSDFLLKVSGAFVLLGVAAKILGGLTPGEMIQAGIAIGAFVGVMAALVAITNLAPKDQIAQISTTLLAMSASIAILAAVAALLGMVPTENLVKGVAAVAALSLLVAMMVKATRGAKEVKGTMMAIAVAIGVMAASIAVLSLLDPARVVVATACMSAVMGMFALIVKMGSNVQTSVPIMAIMVVAIGVMAAAIAILAQMPWQNTLASAVGLSITLLAMAQACKILSGINGVAPMALVAAGVLTAIMAVLAYVLVQMGTLDPLSTLANATALSLMLLAIAEACKILGTINGVAPMALAAAAVLTVVVAVLAAVLYAIRDVNPEASLGNAVALSTLLLAMSASISILGNIGALGPAIWNGLAALGALAVGIGVIVGIVSAIAYFSDGGAIEAVNKGAELFRAIGNAIGSFISGIGEGLTSGLPNIASNLSGFITNLNPFLEGMKGIDPSIGTTIQNLGTGLLALTAGGMLDQITSFFSGESAIGSIGEQLVPFGKAMADFAGALDGVNLGALLVGSQAAKAIADMANAMPKEGGLLDSIFGSTVDLSTFGDQLVDFGDGMKKYAESIAGVDVDSIHASIPAAEGLAELANKLPSEGGLMQSIFGTKDDLSSFGSQLIDFGDGLQKYAEKVAGLDVDSINASIPAAEALNDLANQLPSEGGLMQSIFGGKDDLSGFGTQLTDFGDALVTYAGSVVDLDTGAIEASIDATNGILHVLQAYTNAEDIDTGVANAKKIKDLGDALKSYGEKLVDVDPEKLSSTNTAIQGLKTAINDLVGLDSSGIGGFQSAIDSLASTNVQGLIDAFSGIDLSSVGSNIMSTLAGGIQAGSSKVTSAFGTVVNAMKIRAQISTVQFVSVGAQYMSSLAAGVRTGAFNLVSAMASAISSAAASIRVYYSSFYSAGSYISQGLAAGMRSRLYEIRSVASQMAQEAAKATAAAAIVNSPSRLFMKIGDYLGQGLVIGMENETKSIYNAGYEMGDTAYAGMKSTLGHLSDALSSDIDVNPTIRPVLDLSDIKNGADSINGMLSSTVPMSVLGRISSIDRMMNSRIQNGTFDDVVGAIDKLRTNLSEMGGNTYQINGMTYDDGTNIANTIGALYRQVRIEGRV